MSLIRLASGKHDAVERSGYRGGRTPVIHHGCDSRVCACVCVCVLWRRVVRGCQGKVDTVKGYSPHFYMCVVTTMIITLDSQYTDLSRSRCFLPDEHITTVYHETICISMIISHGIVIIRLVSLCLSLLLFWLLLMLWERERERERARGGEQGNGAVTWRRPRVRGSVIFPLTDIAFLSSLSKDTRLLWLRSPPKTTRQCIHCTLVSFDSCATVVRNWWHCRHFIQNFHERELQPDQYIYTNRSFW